MKQFGILLPVLFLLNSASGQENLASNHRFEPGKSTQRRSTAPAIKPTAPKSGNATVILTAEDVWGDGTGYQMLLDASATAYGTLWANSTAFPMEGTAEDVYADVDYKIPANAREKSCMWQEGDALTIMSLKLENATSSTFTKAASAEAMTRSFPGKSWNTT